ncbi:MAG: redox-sensitive transcriptional activator SoxR [Rhizobiales bacterium]|nr:redox-sensitive transcriptional activator SoxR [Hyphomicrobiales bacterium]
MRGNEIISIGQLAARTGLSVSAIRFYEAKKLVHPERSRGGQRRFLRADIRRLSFVMIAQQLGFPIRDIARMLDALPEQRAPNKRDWAALAKHIRQDLNARIATMIRLRGNLDGCIGCGCLSLARCALYNPEDRAARLGKGPRFVLADRPKDLA